MWHVKPLRLCFVICILSVQISFISSLSCDSDSSACEVDTNTLLQGVVQSEHSYRDGLQSYEKGRTLPTAAAAKLQTDEKSHDEIVETAMKGREVERRSANTSSPQSSEPSNASNASAPVNATAPDKHDSAEEPENAPQFSMCILIFFAFAIVVVVLMVISLAFLQFLIRLHRMWQDKVLSQHEADSLTGKDVRVGSTGRASSKSAQKNEKADWSVTDSVLTAAVNGDHLRLNLLLSLAGSSSSTAESDASEIVQKACKANKLKLSEQAVQQIVKGLLALARSASDREHAHEKGLSPKDKLLKAMRRVLTMVQVTRAMGNHDLHHLEHTWSTHLCSTENHASTLSEKYADGHKDSIHGGHRDIKLNKALGNSFFGATVGAYFASERWIDHSAIIFIFAYSQLCAILYATYLKERFPKMYAFMGPWLLVSRGEAMAIILLSMLMVMLLSRGLVTRLRKVVAPWSSILAVIIDKNVLMHRSCGAMLVVCSALHILGHIRGSIPAIIGETDASKINAAFTYGTKIKFNFNTWGGALRCWPAITGIILVVILACFWALSNERVRRWSFETFHYPHLFLIVAWCVALITHGAKQWLGVGVPLGLLAVAPVTIYYFYERVMDILQGVTSKIFIQDAILKKKSVLLTIDVGDSNITYETGMYCMLKVPEISHFQWHPFTIASAGGQQTFQVLFAVVGDWTTQLNALLQEAQKSDPPRYPDICVRGGYGAPAEGMKDKKHIIMVGAGVGATPFLSFLSNICNSASKGVWSQFDAIESAVFYWVSREPDDFVWVNKYNTTIEENPKLNGRVAIRLCLSRALQTATNENCDATELALFWTGVQIALKSHAATELAAEMGAPTQFGRPDWEKEFSEHSAKLLKRSRASLSEPLEVCVYACGNSMLVESLEHACDALKTDTLSFRLFAEEF